MKPKRNHISKINREIAVINRRQRAVKDTIYLLQKDLTAKKRSYANAVKRMGHQRSEYDELMFIFSASSIRQSTFVYCLLVFSIPRLRHSVPSIPHSFRLHFWQVVFATLPIAVSVPQSRQPAAFSTPSTLSDNER